MCISSYAPGNRFMGHCRVVGHWHESCFILSSGCLEFGGGIYIFGKLWAPTWFDSSLNYHQGYQYQNCVLKMDRLPFYCCVTSGWYKHGYFNMYMCLSLKVQAGHAFCTWRNIATARSVRLVCSLTSVDTEMYADQTCSKCGDGRVEDLGWCNSCLPWQILVQGEYVFIPKLTW